MTLCECMHVCLSGVCICLCECMLVCAWGRLCVRECVYRGEYVCVTVYVSRSVSVCECVLKWRVYVFV